MILKRQYGQVLLNDKNVRDKMINCLNSVNNSKEVNNIIEIGFGHLFLTKHLFKIKNSSLFLYEIDNEIYHKHKKYLQSQKNTKIFNIDFVEHIKNHELSYSLKFKVISNIAFNIFKATITNIILHKYIYNITDLIILIPYSLGISLIEQSSAFAKFTGFFYESKIVYKFKGNKSFSREIDFQNCIVKMNKILLSDKLKEINFDDFYNFIKKLFLDKKKTLKNNKIIKVDNETGILRAHQLTHKQIINLYTYNAE